MDEKSMTEVNIKPKRKYSVQPNVFTNTPGKLSVLERKILYLIYNQLSAVGDNPNRFTIRVSHISRDTNSIRKALKRLRTREHVYQDDDKKYHSIPIVGEMEYLTYKGLVNIELHKKMAAYLLSTKFENGYTSFRLDPALQLNSTYSQKLYEILSKWKDKKSLTISVRDLQTKLSAENKPYGEFKRSCLNLAMKEINEKTEISFSYKEQKEGRTVLHLILCLVEKEKARKQEVLTEVTNEQKFADNMTPAEIADAMYSIYSVYNFSDWQRNAIISDRKLFRNLAKLHILIEEGAVKVRTTPTQYVAASLFVKPKSRQNGLFATN